MAANPDVLAYLIAAAKRRGIDPATAVRAFGHEGLNVFDPSRPDLGGDEGSSFGPTQLHYAGMSKSMPNAGLGDEFTKTTGLDARDPKTWPQQLDFSLDWVKNHGWSPWMGAKAEGITGFMGVNGQPYRPDAKSPQMATDMASPGNTALPVPSSPLAQSPMQGPPTPPDWTPPTPDAGGKSALRQKLAKLAGGFKAPAVAKSDTNLDALRPMPAARVDSAEFAPFDQNQIASQRQNLAMALQRLNSGKLWL